MGEEQTDEQIAREVQQGRPASFAILVERYEGKLLRYARRFLFAQADAEDLVQEVFLKAYTNLQSFDAHRSFSAWVYRIAHNEFINAIKRKGKEPVPFFDPDTLFPHPTAPTRADTELQEQQLKEMLEAVLSQLDPKYREPLVLYYYEDLDYEQISDVLRIPTSTVGIRLKRGKEHLQKIYYASRYHEPQS